MECKDARLMLNFPQAGPDAPTGPEAAALRDHLAVCPECDAAFRAEARLDAHLGRAIRDVPVPSGLKEQLLTRLAAERATAWRKRFMTIARVAAVAAIVLVVVSVASRFLPVRWDRDASEVHIAWNVARPTNAESVEASFAAMGYRDCAPDFVNYAFLVSIGVTDLPGYPGQKTPQLVFVNRDGREVILLAVNQRYYDVKYPERSNEPGYKYSIDVRRAVPGSRWDYIVLYTGDNWDWLYVPPAE